MNDFTNLVKQMRIAQKEYFKSRNFTVLEKSKKLERAVDAEINKILNPELF